MKIKADFIPRLRPRNFSGGSGYCIDNISCAPKLSNPGEVCGSIKIPIDQKFYEYFEL